MPDEEAFSATTVDLTLGSAIQEWIYQKSPPTIYPANPSYKFSEVVDKYTHTIDITTGYIIRPQQFILAWTAERVTLPTESKIAARVEGKSSLARIGIGVHICAPTVHPGFDNKLQLEMCNHGTINIELRPGMKICQLIFEVTLGTPDLGYAGQFKLQTPPQA
jgi:dCTP deaminase